MVLRSKYPLAVVSLLALLLQGSEAFADRGPSDLAASDAHVREARRLRQRRRLMEACAEYEQADRDYPRPDILVELADCYEAAGYPGTAWEVLQRAKAGTKAAPNGPGDGAKTGAWVDRTTNARMSALSNQARIRIALAPGVDATKVELKLDAHQIPTVEGLHPINPELLTSPKHELVATWRGYVPQRWEFKLGRGEERLFKIGPFVRADNGSTIGPDRADDRPSLRPGEVSRGARVRVSAQLLSGIYNLLESQSPTLPAGQGTFTNATFRAFLTRDSATLQLRWSATRVFSIPGADGEFAFSAPAIGGSYKLALTPEITLTPSLLLIPGVVPTASGEVDRIVRRIGNLSGLLLYGGHRWAAAASATLDGKTGPVLVSFGLSVTNAFLQDSSDYTLIQAERLQIGVLATPWLRPYVEGTFFHELVLPKGAKAEAEFTIAGGTAILISDSVQASIGIYRPLSATPFLYRPTMLDTSVTVSF